MSILDQVDNPFIARLGQHQPGPDSLFEVVPSELIGTPIIRYCLQALTSCVDLEKLAGPPEGTTETRTPKTVKTAYATARHSLRAVAYGVPQEEHPCKDCSKARRTCFMTSRQYSGIITRCLACQRSHSRCSIEVGGTTVVLSRESALRKALRDQPLNKNGQVISTPEDLDQHCRQLEIGADMSPKETRELIEEVCKSCSVRSDMDEDTGVLRYFFRLKNKCAEFPAAFPDEQGEVSLPFPIPEVLEGNTGNQDVNPEVPTLSDDIVDDSGPDPLDDNTADAHYSHDDDSSSDSDSSDEAARADSSDVEMDAPQFPDASHSEEEDDRPIAPATPVRIRFWNENNQFLKAKSPRQ